jgi:phosphate transport system substrate-binding protein
MQFRGRKQVMAVGGVVAASLALAACSSSSSSPTTPSISGTINASGSSFQDTFQQVAISNFKSVEPSIKVNYASVGSGTGRSNLASGTVLMAGSDSPIPSSEMSSFKGKTVLYFPVVIGPISLAYNLPGITSLKLDATVIAEIFQGQITTWNNAAIKALNPGVNLPPTTITTAVRSDSSGTTQNFTLFLQDAAPSVWKLGSSSTIKWPATARAGAQNGGVASIVKSTAGAIGYVDFTDAKSSGLTSAEVENKAGDFVAPSAAGASTDAADATIASNLTFAAAWASSNPAAYPVSYQSWDLVYAHQPNANDAALLKAYLGYLLGDGQKLLTSLYYAPLPSSLDQKAVAQLSQITG